MSLQSPVLPSDHVTVKNVLSSVTMLPIAVTVALSALISFQPVAARSGLPYIVPRHLIKVKRQGTLVPSTDATDFGSCTTPQIEGGLGFDNRVEFSLCVLRFRFCWYMNRSFF